MLYIFARLASSRVLLKKMQPKTESASPSTLDRVLLLENMLCTCCVRSVPPILRTNEGGVMHGFRAGYVYYVRVFTYSSKTSRGRLRGLTGGYVYK